MVYPTQTPASGMMFLVMDDGRTIPLDAMVVAEIPSNYLGTPGCFRVAFKSPIGSSQGMWIASMPHGGLTIELPVTAPRSREKPGSAGRSKKPALKTSSS